MALHLSLFRYILFGQLTRNSTDFGASYRVVIAAAMFVLGLIASPRYALAYDPIAPFVGAYNGSAEVVRENGETEKRNMHVEIRQTDGKGFWVKWVTQRMRASGKSKTKSYEVLFEPSGRGDIYSAAMQQNVFGHAVPLNPLKGEPYVWGRIKDNTLTVFSLFISEDGDYEMQQYDRTLVDGGLELFFVTSRNGLPRIEARSFLQRRP